MGPERLKQGDFGTCRSQKAGFPRKIALWIGKAGFTKRGLAPLPIDYYA